MAVAKVTDGEFGADFFAWANRQAALLRAGKFAAADMANIAEEIESMGRSEKRELASRLEVLLLQLLKWRHHPYFRGVGWRLSLEEQRERLADLLADSPSLRPHLADAAQAAYRHARRGAERETCLPRETFPLNCPFTLDQMMDGGFWPE